MLKLILYFSVLIADLLVYFPAVLWVFTARKPNPKDPHSAVSFIVIFLQLYTCTGFLTTAVIELPLNVVLYYILQQYVTTHY